LAFCPSGLDLLFLSDESRTKEDSRTAEQRRIDLGALKESWRS
jgi:hypothetical protein